MSFEKGNKLLKSRISKKKASTQTSEWVYPKYKEEIETLITLLKYIASIINENIRQY